MNVSESEKGTIRSDEDKRERDGDESKRKVVAYMHVKGMLWMVVSVVRNESP